MNIKTTLKIIIIFTVISVVVGYSYYRSKDFIIGPTITITSPQNGISVNNSLIEITGTAKNISYLSMDDRRIYTDEKGKFKEELLLFPGYNIISIKAIDTYKRKIQKTLEIIYNAPTKTATTSPKYKYLNTSPAETSTSTDTINDTMQPRTRIQSSSTGSSTQSNNSIDGNNKLLN